MLGGPSTEQVVLGFNLQLVLDSQRVEVQQILISGFGPLPLIGTLFVSQIQSPKTGQVQKVFMSRTKYIQTYLCRENNPSCLYGVKESLTLL